MPLAIGSVCSIDGVRVSTVDSVVRAASSDQTMLALAIFGASARCQVPGMLGASPLWVGRAFERWPAGVVAEPLLGFCMTGPAAACKPKQ